MFIEDPNELDDFERMMKFHEIAAEYGESIAAWETAPWTSEFELLLRDGVELDEPASLDDEQIAERIWQIAEAMARRNTFMYHTDHLSDRALYTYLWEEVLHEAVKDYAAVLPEEQLTGPCAWFQDLDLCDMSDPDQEEAFLRYYATDEDRAWFGVEWSIEDMPAYESPPYDRDQYLPRPKDAWVRVDAEEYEEFDVPFDEDGAVHFDPPSLDPAKWDDDDEDVPF